MRFGISDRSNILTREDMIVTDTLEKMPELPETPEMPEVADALSMSGTKNKTRKRYTK
jgi:hypothetical protein